MPVTSLLLNLLWIIFGGLWMALAWVVAAILMALTIVGVPWLLLLSVVYFFMKARRARSAAMLVSALKVDAG